MLSSVALSALVWRRACNSPTTFFASRSGPVPALPALAKQGKSPAKLQFSPIELRFPLSRESCTAAKTTQGAKWRDTCETGRQEVSWPHATLHTSNDTHLDVSKQTPHTPRALWHADARQSLLSHHSGQPATWKTPGTYSQSVRRRVDRPNGVGVSQRWPDETRDS